MKHDVQADFCFCVAGEAVAGHGEDSFYYATDETTSLLSVFDGCGGIGARRYQNYAGHTGAFVASRAVSGCVEAWRRESGHAETLQAYIQQALDVCTAYQDGTSGLRGSLSSKTFPTTAAILSVSHTNGSVLCCWAGDSRCYLLDAAGLQQLSRDDVAGSDPMENIRDDGVLQNVIHVGTPFTLHTRSLSATPPYLLLTSTDGCFGYLKSPMEFEALLLSALLRADSLDQWQGLLDASFRDCAGDDYSLCVFGIGFGCFENLKQFFVKRFSLLKKTCLIPMQNGTSPQEIWKIYQKTYLK